MPTDLDASQAQVHSIQNSVPLDQNLFQVENVVKIISAISFMRRENAGIYQSVYDLTDIISTPDVPNVKDRWCHQPELLPS
jgi:hypothetical protein